MKKSQLYLSTMDGNAHRIAKKYGLGIEITEFSTAWNLDRDREKTEKILEPKLPCSDRFILHGPYSELFPCAVDPLIRQVTAYRFRQALEAAKAYGIRKVVFHGGFNERLYFPCWYQEQSVIFWREFAEYIPDNIAVYLENVLEPDPDLLGKIVRQVDCPGIRMCLDVGHAHTYSGSTPMQWLERCQDIIGHFHIHNNDGSWDTHSPLLQGTIPMKPLLEKIDILCPEATATLEIDGAESSVQWMEEEKILEE